MEYSIRKARADDAKGIAALEKRCFETPWPEREFDKELRGNPLSLYVAAVLRSEEIIGYCGLWVILDEGHITNVAVAPELREMGIASRMLIRLFEEAERRGAARFTLEVRRSNEEAIRLYKKFGFAISGYRKGYYKDNNEDAAIMWLNQPGMR